MLIGKYLSISLTWFVDIYFRCIRKLRFEYIATSLIIKEYSIWSKVKTLDFQLQVTLELSLIKKSLLIKITSSK